MTVGRNYLPHGLHALLVAAAAVNFTSTPGNKEIIAELLDVNRLDVENAQGGVRAAG